MKKSTKSCLCFLIALVLIGLASFSVIRHINKYYPTLGMSDSERIRFYFDLELPTDSTIVERYKKDGEFAYKVLLGPTSLNELKLPDNYTVKRYDSYMQTIVTDTKKYIDWWNINESDVKISYERIASPKRGTGKKTALTHIILVEKDGKAYMYMNHID